uniref:C-type lectin domain-containing protein n=1 Tax=Oryzias latipes TaxID=8090 RepID=A0A3P9LRN7_ORYLA
KGFLKLLLLFFLTEIFLRCPGLDWLEFGEFCYKPFGDRKTWQDAQRVCRDLGAELVSIMSMKEQSWVESYFYMGKALEKTTNNLWTGLNDLLVPGMFTWSDDFEVTFTYWAPGEPNNHNGFSEDCVEMLYEVISTGSKCGRVSTLLAANFNPFGDEQAYVNSMVMPTSPLGNLQISPLKNPNMTCLCSSRWEQGR